MTERELTRHLKQIALDMGAVKVGVAGRADLQGPPEADMDAVLPGATNAVSFMAIEPEELVFGYLSKRDPGPYRKHFYDNVQLLGRVGLALADELQRRGHRAEALSPNGVYAKGSTLGRLIPPFSHRYAAHAAGIGVIGLSGNLMTPEYGARVYLSTVITDAPLVADGPLETNPCDDCNLCLHACPTMFMSLTERVSFTLGRTTVTHARKGEHFRCAISCGGFCGLSRDGRWSNLAPSLREIPTDDGELQGLYVTMAVARRRYHAEHPELPDFVRLDSPVDGYERAKQGILARTELDTHTTCGNCAIVCLQTKRQRTRALRTLRTSGVVVGEHADGTPIVLDAVEAREYRESHCEPYMQDVPVREPARS